jgi:hypothetical protein
MNVGCGKPTAGPKVIRADGAIYTACGGVVSVPSARDKVETDPGSYEVFFQDPQGVKRHLTNVRDLTVTDLVADAPACRTAP